MSYKRSAVVLPVAGRRVLMQLRDQRRGILAPGCWGYFGGSLGEGESPRAAAARELYEEIGYAPKKLRRLGQERLRDFKGILVAAYCCELDVPPESLRLTEGMDFGLKSIVEVRAGKIYSERLKGYFPIVPSGFIERMFRAAVARCGSVD